MQALGVTSRFFVDARIIICFNMLYWQVGGPLQEDDEAHPDDVAASQPCLREQRPEADMNPPPGGGGGAQSSSFFSSRLAGLGGPQIGGFVHMFGEQNRQAPAEGFGRATNSTTAVFRTDPLHMQSSETLGALTREVIWQIGGFFGESAATTASDIPLSEQTHVFALSPSPATVAGQEGLKAHNSKQALLTCTYGGRLRDLFADHIQPRLLITIGEFFKAGGLDTPMSDRTTPWDVSIMPCCRDNIALLEKLATAASPLCTLDTWGKKKAESEPSWQALSLWLEQALRLDDANHGLVARENSEYLALANEFVKVCRVHHRENFNAAQFANKVAKLPLLLVVNRSLRTMRDHADKLVREYLALTNGVDSKDDWIDLEKNLGATENQMSNAWVYLSNWMKKNANVQVLGDNMNECLNFARHGMPTPAGGALGGGGGFFELNSDLMEFLRETSASEVDDLDGDGATLYFWDVPPAILALFPAPPARPSPQLPQSAAESAAADRTAVRPVAIRRVTRKAPQREPSSNSDQAEEQEGLRVVVRLPAIDAPEFTQPFLLSKAFCSIALLPRGRCSVSRADARGGAAGGGASHVDDADPAEPLCYVRVSQVYYADHGRLIADMVITTAPPPSSPCATPRPPLERAVEVSLRMILIYIGGAHLMLQYGWCKDVPELHLMLDLHAAAKEGARHNPQYCKVPPATTIDLVDDEEGEAAAELRREQYESSYREPLVKAWETTTATIGAGDCGPTSSTNSSPTAITALKKEVVVFVNYMASREAQMNAFQTVGDFQAALGEKWNREFISVHLVETSPMYQPLVITKAKLPLIEWHRTGKGWWRYDTDPDRSLPSSMIWGKPHHVKLEGSSATTKKSTSSLQQQATIEGTNKRKRRRTD